MKTFLMISLLLVSSLALAKDKKPETYEIGNLTMQMVSTGVWVDNTQCDFFGSEVRCVGGAGYEELPMFVLTLKDGTAVVLRCVPLSRDTVKSFNLADSSAPVQTMYSVQRHGGQTTYVIPDSKGKKEGWYLGAVVKQVKDKPTNVSNVNAMCSGGKLTPEQQTQYCKP